MQVIINASGEGTRLRPLTCGVPTALLPLCGEAAIVKMINHLKKCGADNFIVITGYMSREIEENLKDIPGVKTLPQFNGECGSLKAHSHELDEEFLYFSSVGYIEGDFAALLKYQREKDAYATLFVPPGANLGRVIADKTGRITRFEEKKLWAASSCTGVYVLKRGIVRFIPDETETDLSETLMPSLVRAGKSVYVCRAEGCIEEISDISSYMSASFAALERESRANAAICEGAVVEAGALLEAPCFVAKGAVIKKGAKIGAYSIIGEGAKISSGASVKRSIVSEGARIMSSAALRGCIIDKNAAIGRNSAVYEQAVVGFGSKIGHDVAVRSFVRIWPEKSVEDGKTVSENLIWGAKRRERLFEDGAISGAVNTEITAEFCLRLGESVGTAMEAGEIGVSSDGSPSSSMLRDALISGLLGTGAAVRDFGEQPLPITRRGVAFYFMRGGININTYELGGEEYAVITIIDKGGVDAGDAMKARLDELFEKGSFLRSEAAGISEREYLFEYKLYYLKGLINSTKRKKASLRLLLSCAAQWGRRLLTSAAADFDSTVSIYSPAANEDETAAFAAAVTKGGFDLGFMIDKSCEGLKIVNCDGHIIEGAEYEALSSLIVMKRHKNAKIYVPVTASGVIETLGEKYGAEVIRTKTEPQKIMEEISGGEDYLTEQFIFRFDAVGSVIKIIDYLSDENTTLTELLSLLPEITMTSAQVELKEGEIENALSRVRALKGAESDTPEGVKVSFDKGWVLVIPDSRKHTCRVVSEARSAEFARELCDICIEELIASTGEE